jgi:hypothetical protein
MPKFRQETAGDDGWSRWIQPVQDYKMACCDCGLVHNIQWNILKVTNTSADARRFSAENLPWGEYRLEMRVSRNKRSTAQIRRHQKK